METGSQIGVGTALASFFLRYVFATIPAPVAWSGGIAGLSIVGMETFMPGMRPPLISTFLYIGAALLFGTGITVQMSAKEEARENQIQSKDPAAAPTSSEPLMPPPRGWTMDGIISRENGRDGIRIEGGPPGSMKNVETSRNKGGGVVIVPDDRVR